MRFGKKGLEATIATVLLILLSLIAIAVVGYFVFPLVKNSLDDGGCSEAINSISLDDSTYTCIASSSTETFTGFSIKANNPQIDGFLVALHDKGTAIPFEIKKDKRYPALRMIDGVFNGPLTVRNDGSTRTYVAAGAYSRIDVAPILKSGKTCDNARSVVDLKNCLDPSVRNQITSQSSGNNNSDGAPFCGDGNVDWNLGEECDGNSESCNILGYSGTRTCFPPLSANECAFGPCLTNQTCGDNICNGPENVTTCNIDCELCGNGVVNPGEGCDNGILNSNTVPNACRNSCQLPSCGDGVCDANETQNSCSVDCGSPALSCHLTGAYWEINNAIDGQQVNLFVNGDNCNGKSIAIVVKEDDVIDDDDVSTNPNNAVFSGNSASTTWIAEWQSDWPSNPPEFYFIVTEVTNDSNFVESLDSAELIVYPASETCGDGHIDSGETCDDGDTDSGDGCSNICLIENGYDCNNEPSTCTCNSDDSDNDGILDCSDNCPYVGNPGQQDTDFDGIGDACDSQYCGNLIIEMGAGEECDGTNLNPGGTQCTNYGHSPAYTSGNVFCTTSCTINFLGCGYCGDGIVNGPEECDGNNFGSHTNLCANYTHTPPYTGGQVTCSLSCGVNFAQCTTGAIGNPGNPGGDSGGAIGG